MVKSVAIRGASLYPSLGVFCFRYVNHYCFVPLLKETSPAALRAWQLRRESVFGWFFVRRALPGGVYLTLFPPPEVVRAVLHR